MTEGKESTTDRAIREALESVERIERESKAMGGEGEPVEETIDVEGALQRRSTSDALLEVTIKAKQEMQQALEQTQKEAKDMYDRLARVSADFENFKKRVTREKQDAIKFGNEGAFKELLPVLDNLNRALAAAANESGTLVDGVRLVARQFVDAFAKLGVTGFDSLGVPFDPVKHEAIGARADASIPAQRVAEEYQRGYMLHDRLLRPALVIVSSGPAPAEQPN